MTLRPAHSLRRRVGLLFLGSFAASLLILSFVFRPLLEQIWDTAEQQSHAEVAGALAEALQPFLSQAPEKGVLPYPAAAKHFERYNAWNPDLAVYLLDGEGQVIQALSTGISGPLRKVPLEPIRAFRDGFLNRFPITNIDPRTGERSTFSAADISLGGHPGFLYAVLKGSPKLSEARAKIRSFGNGLSLMAILLAGILCSFGLGMVPLLSLSRRFDRILGAAERYRAGEFRAQVHDRRSDEIGVLAKTINEMAGAIDANLSKVRERDELQSELIANISHDLRSPATHIRLAADELSRVLPNPTSCKETVSRLQQGAVDLEHTLRHLFDLAQIDTAPGRLQQLHFSLEELFEDLLPALRRHAEARNCLIELETSGDTGVFGDPSLIARVIEHLISDLLRTARTGSRILVTIALVDSQIELKMTRSGTPIIGTEGSESRIHGGRASAPSESGLGATIARRVLMQLQTKLHLYEGVDGTFAVWFRLLRNG